MRPLFLLITILVLQSGCSPQHAGHTVNVGQVLARVERDQIYRHIAEFYVNPSRIPVTYEILAGSATLNSGVGANTDVSFVGTGAFRALNLSGDIAFQRNFTITPVMALSSRLRARELFRYAICNELPRTSEGFPRDPCDFEVFRVEFEKYGTIEATGRRRDGPDSLTTALMRLVGPLPRGPLVGRGAQCDRNPTREVVGDFYADLSAIPYCFIEAGGRSSQEVQARFTQWVASVTQAIADGGIISQVEKRGLLVPAGPEFSIGPRR